MNLLETLRKILSGGLLLTLLLVLSGGLYYLWQQGLAPFDYHQYQHFKAEALTLTSITFSARGLITLGLFLLVFLQCSRVLVSAWFFIKTRETFLSMACFAILWVLLYSFIL